MTATEHDKAVRRGKKAGRPDRVLKRKLWHLTKRCRSCRALNSLTAGECWKCGASLGRRT